MKTQLASRAVFSHSYIKNLPVLYTLADNQLFVYEYTVDSKEPSKHYLVSNTQHCYVL